MRHVLLPLEKSLEGWYLPSSAFFCHHCGDLWAKLERPNQIFMVYTVPCANHEFERRYTVPGSVIQSWLHDDYLTNAPLNDLLNELEVHCNFALRQLGEPT